MFLTYYTFCVYVGCARVDGWLEVAKDNVQRGTLCIGKMIIILGTLVSVVKMVLVTVLLSSMRPFNFAYYIRLVKEVKREEEFGSEELANCHPKAQLIIRFCIGICNDVNNNNE